MVVPPRSQRCLKHSEHKQRSSGARRPMQRIDPRSVSPGIEPRRQTLVGIFSGGKRPAPITPCVETALDFGAGDSALGESALEILKLGASGVGDASVHRWRRSDATGATTA